jgi:hypothetical protein
MDWKENQGKEKDGWMKDGKIRKMGRDHEIKKGASRFFS